MDEMDFEEWFDYFQEAVRHLGYHGPIDSHTFEDDFYSGVDYHDAAEEFVKEMNE